jgi:hypothetical protein
MTAASVASGGLTALQAAAAAADLMVLSCASWPEEDDGEVTPLAGFIDSNFSPLVAEVAGRALARRALARRAVGLAPPEATAGLTAIVLVTALGDVTSAARVAAAVDAGKRVPPLQFFQCVPNAVAGYLAARWHLAGPVACVSGTTAGLDVAALLIDDGDADDVLVVRADLAVTAGQRDSGAAILVTRCTPSTASGS